MDSITIQEALAQGYTHYVYNEDGYQSLKEISDNEDINWNRNPEVVGKEGRKAFGISSKDIAELLAEHLDSQ